MQCPKCDHYHEDFSSLGGCETCGRIDWQLWKDDTGAFMIMCPHCQIGWTEVPCVKCGATMLGTWLAAEGPAWDDFINWQFLRKWVKVFWIIAIVVIPILIFPQLRSWIIEQIFP